MPKTRAKLDSLFARLLERESLVTIVVIALAVTGALSDAEMIGSGAAGVVLVAGRSLVKAMGRNE